MSSITAPTSLLPSLSFHGHGHRHGSAAAGAQALGGASASSSGSSIGQLPVGVSSALFSNLVQSFQQTLGAQAATSAGSISAGATAVPASGSAAASAGIGNMTPGQRQELQAFQHSLIQALKQDGMSANGTGDVVSSLKTLINQLGPEGKATAATSTLSATFQNLLSGVNGAAAASASSSNAALQSFLSSLMQNVQASGVQSLASTGTNVNAHV